ncbi:NUDIX hydrolase domain-like protein [Dioszegia hungarica]|uniref:NUDIX hydrolase domain-like protein n=1 Tax=Dioszegia hungarica TaxID=4972 RepID=A0AA38LVU9_9TREE|nr:NUDIX hydrolase domain-like protein [Dioszegia hungarica]KAI9635984.1 NUDIX hydrolase domain-like protein [Dioszegia hungarica]
MRSLLSIVEAADNLPAHPSSPYPTHSPDGTERYVPFHLTFSDFQASLAPVGLLRPTVLAELQADDGQEEGSPWQFYLTASASGSEAKQKEGNEGMEVDEHGEDLDVEVQCCFFADWVVRQGEEGMSRVMRETAERWKKEGKFAKQLAGWRNELYQIYASPKSSFFSSTAPQAPFANKAFTLERAACALFGLATFGVHLMAYEGEGKDMMLWVPRRSTTKPTFPGMLDNTVAGGIPAGISPLESMIKECQEEASLPESFVVSRLKAAGVITYFYITPDGYLQPELEYIYDLPLPSSTSAEYIKPKPCDDEVESFALMNVPDTLTAMYAGEFKPNCGSVIVDFMIRHGMVATDDEPNYLEIRWRLARRLGVAVPSG